MAARGIPGPGGDKGTSEGDDCGSRVAVRSCADLKSRASGRAQDAQDLKSERRRASFRARCCRRRSRIGDMGAKMRRRALC